MSGSQEEEGEGKEEERGMPKLKAHAERLFFFLNLADVCWKSVLGT